MKTWDDWSDLDINTKMCAILNVQSSPIGKAVDEMILALSMSNDAAVRLAIKGFSESQSVNGKDYCNNPADMWPIIVNNKIGVHPDAFKDGNWFAFDIDELIMQENTNPLRSAAIVFLEMNGVKP